MPTKSHLVKYNHIDFAPTVAAREAARRALASDETTPSPPNVARATVAAVAAGRRLTPPVLRRLASGAEDDAVASWARKVTAAMDAADKAASSGASQGVVAVVLALPPDLAEYVSLADGDDLHVTLAMLGDASLVTPEAHAMACACVERWAAETPPLPATLSGVGRFAGVDADVVYLSVDAPGLSAARDDLCRRLRDLGLALPSTHGFTPHATLCYVAKGAETPSLPYDLPIAFTLDCAAVWRAGNHGAHVPLTGNADPRTMRDTTTVRGEGITLLFDAASTPTVGHKTWNQIARFGTWKGHPQGPFAFDARVFAEIVRNFRAQKNPVTVDFEHASELLPDNVAQEGVPSLAWIVDLEDRGAAGLWALFEWVDAKAVEYVRSKQYRYVSPSVRFAAICRETAQRIGARLTSVALTNQPFLDGLAPLTASDNTTARASAPTKDTPPMPDTTPPIVTPEAAPDTTAADLAATSALLATATVRLSEMDGNAAKMSADFAALNERYNTLASGVRKMAGVGAEEDENAALAKLQGIVDKMVAAQEAEAASMADRAIAGHGLAAKARPMLIAHAMRDAADFVETYPKSALSTNASDAAPKPAGAPIPPAAKTLLSEHVTPSNSPPAPIVGITGTVAEVSRAREDMAQQLLRDGKAPNYFTAVTMADDALTARRRSDAVAPFVS